MLKAVLFDLDGVITDSAKYHYCLLYTSPSPRDTR